MQMFLRFEEAILLNAGPPPKHISPGREKENERKSHINQSGPL